MSKDNSESQSGDFKNQRHKVKDGEDKNSSGFDDKDKRLLLVQNMLVKQKKEKKPYFAK